MQCESARSQRVLASEAPHMHMGYSFSVQPTKLRTTATWQHSASSCLSYFTSLRAHEHQKERMFSICRKTKIVHSFAVVIHGILDEKCPVTTVKRINLHESMPHAPTLLPPSLHVPVSDTSSPNNLAESSGAPRLASHVPRNSKTTRKFSSFVTSSDFLSQKSGHPNHSTTKGTPRSSRPPTSLSQTSGLPNRSTTMCRTKRTPGSSHPPTFSHRHMVFSTVRQQICRTKRSPRSSHPPTFPHRQTVFQIVGQTIWCAPRSSHPPTMLWLMWMMLWMLLWLWLWWCVVVLWWCCCGAVVVICGDLW